MPVIKSSTPVLDDAGNPAVGRRVFAYRADNGALVGVSRTSDGTDGNANWSLASTLLSMEGPEGGTDFFDPKGVRWTPVGGASLSSVQPFNGATSLDLDGVAKYLLTPPSTTLDFGTGPFCIRGRFRIDSFSRLYPTIIANNLASWQAGCFDVLIRNLSPSTRFLEFGANDPAAPVVGTTLIAAGVDYYFEVCRDAAGVVRVFLNGLLEGSRTYTGAVNFGNNGTRIGADGWSGENSLFDGWIKDIYVGKHAGNTAAYAPPATMESPYPNLGAGHYEIQTTYTGEVFVVCQDDTAGTTYNHKILRTVLA